MPTTNHGVRIYVPFHSNSKKPYTNHNGHYDLHLADSSFTFNAYQIGDDVNVNDPQQFSFNEPVISYGGRSGEGYLTIKNRVNMTNRPDSLLCYFPFTGTDEGKANLKTWLQSYIRYDPVNSDSTTKLFKVIHPEFSTYSAPDSNCFMVTALFCNTLGYPTLQNICDDASSYTQYTAWPMFMQHKANWELVDLNLT